MKIKKLFLIFFFIFTYSEAHITHYTNLNKIEMEIFRNDELIGYSHYFFIRKNDITQVINQVKFIVKILGAKVFSVEGYAEEKYYKNKLISFESKTIQNNKNKFVKLILDKENNKFIINASSYVGDASTENLIGNWWNHRLLQATTQISPISGSIKKQVITFIAKEKIKLYGKNFESEHFKLTSKDVTLPKNKKLNFDLWIDKKTGLILKVKYSKMGNWEYRLKSYE